MYRGMGRELDAASGSRSWKDRVRPQTRRRLKPGNRPDIRIQDLSVILDYPDVRHVTFEWPEIGLSIEVTYDPKFQVVTFDGPANCAVELITISTTRRDTRAFLCPRCRRQCSTLVLPPGGHEFVCTANTHAERPGPSVHEHPEPREYVMSRSRRAVESNRQFSVPHHDAVETGQKNLGPEIESPIPHSAPHTCVGRFIQGLIEDRPDWNRTDSHRLRELHGEAAALMTPAEGGWHEVHKRLEGLVKIGDEIALLDQTGG